MSGKHPKTTDSLMRYLRDQKGIAINGSFQKRKLMNIGYYHGYKGYRFIRQPRQRISFTSLDEVIALNSFEIWTLYLIDLSQTIVCTPEEAIPIISSTKNV